MKGSLIKERKTSLTGKRLFAVGGVTILMLVLLAGLALGEFSRGISGDDTAAAISGDGKVSFVRWDLVIVDRTAGTVSPGGKASAYANDGSKITMTGSGTFIAVKDVMSPAAKGGGTWETEDQNGNITGNGTYKVTGLVSWSRAPGTLPPVADLIGDPDDASAGLAVLGIKYSDGDSGVLIVSCHLVGSPDSIFEGITASKGYADYWNRSFATTLFHVTRSI